MVREQMALLCGSRECDPARCTESSQLHFVLAALQMHVIDALTFAIFSHGEFHTAAFAAVLVAFSRLMYGNWRAGMAGIFSALACAIFAATESAMGSSLQGQTGTSETVVEKRNSHAALPDWGVPLRGDEASPTVKPYHHRVEGDGNSLFHQWHRVRHSAAAGGNATPSKIQCRLPPLRPVP